MRLYIAIVSNRDHKAAFSGAFYALTQLLARKGHEIGIESHAAGIGSGHSCLPAGRQLMLDHALQGNYTHLLCLDDDMVFSPDVLPMMLGRKKPVIGANYVMKALPPKFTASNDEGRVSSKGKTGIEAVHRLGMGLMLIELDAIRAVPAPHFEIKWHPEKKQYTSEDNYFCDKLRSHGLEIYVDHDASQLVGHIGNYEYAA